MSAPLFFLLAFLLCVLVAIAVAPPIHSCMVINGTPHGCAPGVP